jgi:acetyl-CoA acetyltransferase
VKDVNIRGAAMTKFGRHFERSARNLVEEAVREALSDAEVQPSDVQAAYVGNAVSGLMNGQESIRGQVVLRHTGILGVPIVNVENACASSSTALNLGWMAIASGMYDCVVVVGYEKLYDRNKLKSFRAFDASMDLDELKTTFGDQTGRERSVFMDLYALISNGQGDGHEDPNALALVSVKNHKHGALNPFSQYREEITVEQVLASRPVVPPLTVLMCAPLSDGAAALVLTSARFRGSSSRGVKISASVLVSGRGDDVAKASAVDRAVTHAYEMAGVSSSDLDVIELHDATASAELHLYETLGLCGVGDSAGLVRDRVTWLGGSMPVNPSGGLLSRGHPIGATGAAQVVELTWQLQGRCGPRQVPDARLALAQNAGGWIGTDAAACGIHILER